MKGGMDFKAGRVDRAIRRALMDDFSSGIDLDQRTRGDFLLKAIRRD